MGWEVQSVRTDARPNTAPHQRRPGPVWPGDAVGGLVWTCPWSTDGTTIRPRCCAVRGSRQTDPEISPSFNMTHSIFPALQSWALRTLALPPPTLATADPLALLSSPGCHVLGVVQCVAFSDRLLLLRNMYLRFLDVIPWPESSFPFALGNILFLNGL